MSSQEETCTTYVRQTLETLWLVECGVVIGAVATFIVAAERDPFHYHGKIFPGAILGGLAGYLVSQVLPGGVGTEDDHST